MSKRESATLRQAAIVLSALPKAPLAAILKRLAPAHAAALASQLTRLGSIDQSELNLAIKRFLEGYTEEKTPAVAAAEPQRFDLSKPSWVAGQLAAGLQSVADSPPATSPVPAAGEQTAERFATDPLDSPNTDDSFGSRTGGPLPLLEELPLPHCLQLLHDEEPTFLATVLFLLTAKKAAALVERMSLRRRVHVLQILAQIESVSPDTIQHVRQRLQRKIEFGAGMHTRPEGLHRARQLLEQLNAGVQKAIADGLAANDPHLAAELHRHAFRFNDLVRLHRNDIRKIVNHIPMDQWAPALTFAENRVRERVLAAMSPEMARTVREQMKDRPEMTIEDSADWQQHIVNRVNELFRKREIQRPSAWPQAERRAA